MIKFYSLNKKTVFAAKNYVSLILLLAIGLLTISSARAQNNSFKFDGANDFINLPLVLTGDYTKEVWIKVDAITGDPQNVLTGAGTAIYVDGTGHLGGGNLTELSDPTPLTPGQWYHVALSFNQTSGALNLYKDGILVSSAVNLNGYYEPSLQIGAYNDAYTFSGSIDEVRIFNIERSATEIAADFNCEISHRTPGLVAYYNFNQGTANGDNTGITNLKDVADVCVPNNGTFSSGVALNGTTSNFTDDVPAGFTICTPESIIRLTGVSGICIDNGDNTPSLSDGTNFGVAVESSSTNSFIIRNNGTSNLDITSISSSTIDFTPNFTIPVSIAPGSSYTFSITFNQSPIAGVKTSTITISNNDVNYLFDISGTNAFKGKALAFNGNYSFVQTPVTITGSYTKEAWINLKANPAPGSAANILTGNNSALYINDQGLLGGGNLTETSDIVPIVPGVWTHVAISYDAVSGMVNLYKNGVLVDSKPSSPFTSDVAQQIGAFNAGYFFNGQIDEVRIWSVARTTAQILSSLNCKIADDAVGLVAYYDFNQGVAGLANPSETNLEDRTCAHNDGTLILFELSGTDANWVAPGAPVALSCEGVVPNIRVTGLGNCIAISIPPSTVNGTDFGLYSSPGIDRIFTIINTGTSTLSISGVSISGTGAAGFTILSGGGASTVQPGDSIKIKVRFIHTVNETLSAILTITNNDPNEGTYNINLQGTGVGVVPVSLVSFTGVLQNKVVNLNWNTAIEINNAGFDIMRSNGSDNWVKIGYVAASGIETGSMYKFTDLAPLSGINTYRLTQIDIDGSSKLSNIVSINNLTKTIIVKTYPNPFKDRFTLVFNDKTLLNSNAKLSSITGNRIANIKIEGYNQSIDLSKYSQGMYILTLENGQSLKLIKN